MPDDFIGIPGRNDHIARAGQIDDGRRASRQDLARVDRERARSSHPGCRRQQTITSICSRCNEDDVSKKSLKILDQKLVALAGAAAFDVTVNSVVGGGIRNPDDALTVAQRTRVLGFSRCVRR